MAILMRYSITFWVVIIAFIVTAKTRRAPIWNRFHLVGVVQTSSGPEKWAYLNALTLAPYAGDVAARVVLLDHQHTHLLEHKSSQVASELPEHKSRFQHTD